MTTMSTTNENIRLLLEMLDNPEAYSAQEIHDIINRDEDTRATYRLMVEARRCRRPTPVDVDGAWQAFCRRRHATGQGRGWLKAAAIFLGIVFVSGLAFAAIHLVRQGHGPATVTPQQTAVRTTPAEPVAAPSDTARADTLSVQPVIYDNTPLEKMLPEIALHYGADVTFANDDVRQLRFRFVWNPQKGIDQVVNDLNQFERLRVSLKENQIIVE